MKRTAIVFIVSALVLGTTCLWIFSSGSLKAIDLISFGIILLLVAFALFVGYKRLTSLKNGEPAEDELTRKVMKQTASFSYYISLYLWLAIMYFSEKLNYEAHTLIGAGILGMAVVFGICWLFFNFRGIKND